MLPPFIDDEDQEVYFLHTEMLPSFVKFEYPKYIIEPTKEAELGKYVIKGVMTDLL